MEIFQSRLEEAEKVASRKKDYDRIGRWNRSYYSKGEKEKTEQHVKKEMRDEDDRNYTGEKYGKRQAQEDKGYKRDTSREDQGHRHSSTDSVVRDYSSKAEKDSDLKRSWEKGLSLSNMKHKFLKPSDDDLSSYSASRDYKSQQSSSKVPDHSSLSSRFQKPSEDTALWTKTHTEDTNEKLVSDEKSSGSREKTDDSSWRRTSSDEKEKSPQEYLSDIPEKKQKLTGSKPSFSRYFTNVFSCLLFAVFFMAKYIGNSMFFVPV